MPIRFIGLVNFDPQEQSIIKELSEEYYDKILRDIQNALLIVDLKKYERKQKNSKYAFHSRVEGPSLMLISKASDWDIKRTLHKLFKKLEKELQHKYKIKGGLPKH